MCFVSGPPRLARAPSPGPGPCLDFGFQYALIRNKRSKKNWGRILGLSWLKFAVASLCIIMFFISFLRSQAESSFLTIAGDTNIPFSLILSTVVAHPLKWSASKYKRWPSPWNQFLLVEIRKRGWYFMHSGRD